jgi:hypothetical protein
MSLTYFLNDLQMVPVAPIIIAIPLVFTFHMRCISSVRSLYFSVFVQLHPYFLAYVVVYLRTHFIMPFYILLFCYYYYYYYYYVLLLLLLLLICCCFAIIIVLLLVIIIIIILF